METALLSGRVAHQIICYARDKRIGFIVLGTPGRTGVDAIDGARDQRTVAGNRVSTATSRSSSEGG
jgi:hypothetical protein